MANPTEAEQGHITFDAAMAAFNEVTAVLNEDLKGSLKQNATLAAMVGDDESYAALVAASERFLKDNPDISYLRLSNPATVALLAGLVVGASVRKPEQ